MLPGQVFLELSNKPSGNLKSDMGNDLKLYDYWRSSSAYRIRIALNLKRLDYQQIPVNLAPAVSQQKQSDYLAINPQGRVPALSHKGQLITQSLAIFDYLEEVFPRPALLPAEPLDRARVRSLAQIVISDIQPLNNLSVTTFLTGPLGLSDAQRDQWYRQWISRGFDVFEKTLVQSGQSGHFCFGDQPSLADLCLVPQVYNAERFDCDMDPFPKIRKITAYCRGLEPFQRAAPENQADAV